MASDQKDIQEVVAELENEMPEAQIRVVDETIHIVVNDISEASEFVMHPTSAVASGRTTSVTSSSGGTFSNFDVPYYMMSVFAPYAQVYMPQSVVESVKMKMTSPDIFDYILTLLQDGYTQTAIVSLVLAKFGVSIPVGTIASVFTVVDFAVPFLDYSALVTAQSQSVTVRVSVVRGSADGYYSNIYFPWNDNVCSTYAGLEATWHPGEYAI